MNFSTKVIQMDYFPCPKFGMIQFTGTTYFYNLQVIKELLKNDQELKSTFQNMSLQNTLYYQQCPKIKHGLKGGV